MLNHDWTPNPHILAVVNKELDRLRGVIEFTEPTGDKYEQWTKHISAQKYPEGCARLRLDFELSEEVDDRSEALKLMFDFVAIDLADLLENGDTDDDADPLLSSINGKNKLGKELKAINIPSAVIYREHKERKKTWEYTFYLLMVPEWS